jgi:AraC-like DNA-binding protein
MKIGDVDVQPTNYFAKIKCEPSWKWVKRDKPFEHYDLFYVWDGIGTVEVNGLKYEVRKGCCFLFRPGDYTSAVHSPQNPLTITYVHFHIKGTPYILPQRFQMMLDTIDIEILLSRYVHLRLVNMFGAVEESNLILKQILIHLIRNEFSDSVATTTDSQALADVIYEVANFMHEHPSGWFKMEQLAERVQLSPPYFSSKFKQIIGMTVQAYAIRCRIERAQVLLRFGGMKVTEVADALGYKDVYFFSRQYKKFTGRVPSSDR